MSTFSARKQSNERQSRILKYFERARARFDLTRQGQGSIAALGVICRDLGRSITFRAAQTGRLVRRSTRLGTPFRSQDRVIQPGVLFIGYLEAGLGLGESLRGLIGSLTTTGLPFALYPFNLGVETRFVGPFRAELYDLRGRYQVNVIEMSADQVPVMFRELGRWKTSQSYNILRTYWELPQAPPAWAHVLKGIHELWVPNEFVGQAFREIFAGPINVVPPCVEINSQEILQRAAFGMDPDRFYFMFSFDYFSYPARKNPLGVLRAFQLAFQDLSEEVGLVIKSTGRDDLYPDIRSSILQAANSDPRIKVIDRMFSRGEMLALIHQSDCYVSLHRSEGFGLGMAEAMAFGKPVIGTDYSGNTDFLSDSTGFPVAFTLRPVRRGEYVFSDGQIWAEPDEVAAAEAMRRVFYDAVERQRRADSGRAFVESRYGRDNVGRIAARRLEEILATGQQAISRAGRAPHAPLPPAAKQSLSEAALMRPNP